MREIEQGLALQPNEPGLLELRGVLKSETGRPGEGLLDLDQALSRAPHPLTYVHKAAALSRLGRDEESVHAWSLALRRDSELPQAFLGRARSYIRLRL